MVEYIFTTLRSRSVSPSCAWRGCAAIRMAPRLTLTATFTSSLTWLRWTIYRLPNNLFQRVSPGYDSQLSQHHPISRNFRTASFGGRASASREFATFAQDATASFDDIPDECLSYRGPRSILL